VAAVRAGRCFGAARYLPRLLAGHLADLGFASLPHLLPFGVEGAGPGEQPVSVVEVARTERAPGLPARIRRQARRRGWGCGVTVTGRVRLRVRLPAADVRLGAAGGPAGRWRAGFPVRGPVPAGWPGGTVTVLAGTSLAFRGGIARLVGGVLLGCWGAGRTGAPAGSRGWSRGDGIDLRLPGLPGSPVLAAAGAGGWRLGGGRGGEVGQWPGVAQPVAQPGPDR
jgi:hypothetical protein